MRISRVHCICDSDTENYLSVWCQTHYDVTDQNNNEGINIHYH